MLRWIHELKEYCKQCVKGVNIYSTLLSWYASEGFTGRSWDLFLNDFAATADIWESPLWRQRFGKKETPVDFIQRVLDKQLFQWYEVHSQLPSYTWDIFLKDFTADDEGFTRLKTFVESCHSLDNLRVS